MRIKFFVTCVVLLCLAEARLGAIKKATGSRKLSDFDMGSGLDMNMDANSMALSMGMGADDVDDECNLISIDKKRSFTRSSSHATYQQVQIEIFETDTSICNFSSPSAYIHEETKSK